MTDDKYSTDGREPALILAADDNADNLALLLELLEPEGYRVLVARDGKAALQTLALQPVDLVLMDVHMPVMEGYEACRCIKQQERLADIPVIFLSGITESFNKIQAFASGGADYITKPFNTSELLARVSTHLNLYRSRRELQAKNQELQELIKKLSETGEALAAAREKAAVAELQAELANELNNPLNYLSVGLEAIRADIHEAAGLLAQPLGLLDSNEKEVSGNAGTRSAYSLSAIAFRERKILAGELPDLLDGMEQGLDKARAIVRRMLSADNSAD
ncbi:MAG: response regulator [Spirochaetes bacterium]|nr:response regulator [Spirochaetota bacterium]MBU0955731.1 response regulator [Spirochaetota bacterium]